MRLKYKLLLFTLSVLQKSIDLYVKLFIFNWALLERVENEQQKVRDEKK